MAGGFTRGMLEGLERKMILQVFSKHVDTVDYRINDGKEATVYLCRSVPEQVRVPFVAAKVYRDRRFRGCYQRNQSRVRLDSDLGHGGSLGRRCQCDR